VAKNHNFGQILTLLGLLYRPPFTDQGQIWCARADPRSIHLQAKCHLNLFIVSASDDQKPQFLANFDVFGGSCTDPPLPMRAKFGSYSRLTVYVYLRNFVSIGLFCLPVAAKPPNFCRFCRLLDFGI